MKQSSLQVLPRVHEQSDGRAELHRVRKETIPDGHETGTVRPVPACLPHRLHPAAHEQSPPGQMVLHQLHHEEAAEARGPQELHQGARERVLRLPPHQVSDQLNLKNLN